MNEDDEVQISEENKMMFSMVLFDLKVKKCKQIAWKYNLDVETVFKRMSNLSQDQEMFRFCCEVNRDNVIRMSQT